MKHLKGGEKMLFGIGQLQQPEVYDNGIPLKNKEKSGKSFDEILTFINKSNKVDAPETIEINRSSVKSKSVLFTEKENFFISGERKEDNSSAVQVNEDFLLFFSELLKMFSMFAGDPERIDYSLAAGTDGKKIATTLEGREPALADANQTDFERILELMDRKENVFDFLKSIDYLHSADTGKHSSSLPNGETVSTTGQLQNPETINTAGTETDKFPENLSLLLGMFSEQENYGKSFSSLVDNERRQEFINNMLQNLTEKIDLTTMQENKSKQLSRLIGEYIRLLENNSKTLLEFSDKHTGLLKGQKMPHTVLKQAFSRIEKGNYSVFQTKYIPFVFNGNKGTESIFKTIFPEKAGAETGKGDSNFSSDTVPSLFLRTGSEAQQPDFSNTGMNSGEQLNQFISGKPDVLQLMEDNRPVTYGRFIEKFTSLLARGKFINNGRMQILIIQLEPKHLGTLKIELIQNKGEMIAKLVSSTQLAKDLMESQAYALKQAFHQQNLPINRIDFIHGLTEDEFIGQDEQNADGEEAGREKEQNQQQDDDQNTGFLETFEQTLLNYKV